MTRFARPGWRLLGSFTGWTIFAFSFFSLFQVAAVVSGLGGFCASGGPYVIETQCPDSVVVLAPISVFGMLIGVGIGAALARGFGVPLLVWAWPILFVGLGLQFGGGALQGDIVGAVLAVMFIAMGLVPLVLELRAGAARAFIGSHDLRDRPFASPENSRRSIYAFGRNDPTEPVPMTAADAGLSLGLFVFSASVGAMLSVSAFQALAAAG